MPHVDNVLGYNIFFWSKEKGEPPHVHICKGKPHSGATKIWIDYDEPRLEHNRSQIPSKDLKRLLQWVALNREMLITMWHDHFDM